MLSRGGGTSLAGQCTNEAVMLDWSKYCNRVVSRRPRRATLRRRARHRPRRPQRASWRRARPALRSRAGHPPELHARRHDRQQLVRCDRPAHRQGRRQHRLASRCCYTTAPGSGAGRPATRSTPRSSGRGDRRAEIYRSPAPDARRATRDAIRSRYPDIPRRVSGYNLDSLLPEHGFDIAGLLVGQRVDAGDGPAGGARARARAVKQRRSSCSVSRASTRPPTPCRRSCGTSRSRSRDSTTG